VRTLKYITQKSLLFIAPTLDALAMKSDFYKPWQNFSKSYEQLHRELRAGIAATIPFEQEA
jgi:hypothetical protein